METAKIKIKAAVDEYVRLFPEEFKQFKESVAHKQDGSMHEMEESDVIDRALYEVPEVLHYAIKRQLTEDEWKWFQSVGSRSGAKWFVESFPPFAITKAY